MHGALVYIKDSSRERTRHRYSRNENRPDIVVYDSGCSYDLDVAMAHPLMQSRQFKAGSFRGRIYCSKKGGKEDDQI